MSSEHNTFLQLAYQEALKAQTENEVPIGGIVDSKGEVIASAYNQKETLNDPTAHAELMAVQLAAKKQQTWRLRNHTLYSTLEPCPMCFGAILQSRIETVYFGAYDHKWGACGTILDLSDYHFNHSIKSTYIENDYCAPLLSSFFKSLR